MIQKAPLKFALGFGLAVVVALFRPGWISSGFVGTVFVTYVCVMSILVLFALLVAISDLLSKPEGRLVESMPWGDLVASVVGYAVLLWVVYRTSGSDVGGAVVMASVLVSLAMFGFSRWNAARVRRSAA